MPAYVISVLLATWDAHPERIVLATVAAVFALALVVPLLRAAWRKVRAWAGSFTSWMWLPVVAVLAGCGEPPEIGHTNACPLPVACSTSPDCGAWGAACCGAPHVGICTAGAAPSGDAACTCNDASGCVAPSMCSTAGAPCCVFFQTDAGAQACSGKCTPALMCDSSCTDGGAA